MTDLFENPIKTKTVRRDVNAYVYINGCINIAGTKYFLHSLTEAIRIWRSKNPIR